MSQGSHYSSFFLDLPPVYAYPPITMGYKAGPSPPEARLAEQATAEVEPRPEPAQPDAKSLHHPCHIQTLTEEEGRSEEEDGIDCEVVACHSGVGEVEKEEARLEAKGCSVSEPESNVSGLPPCPSTVLILDSDCTATGKAQKVDLFLGCSGQKGLEESQLSKETESGRENEKEDAEEEEEDEKEKTGSEQTECTVSVPVEPGLEEKQAEEGGDKEGENVEVVEDDEEKEALCPGQNVEELTSHASSPSTSPCPSPSSDPAIPPLASMAARRERAYIWSLELLIASALCDTRDALYTPVPPVWAPIPTPQHGLEILAEISELGTLHGSRESKEKVTAGECNGKYIFFFYPAACWNSGNDVTFQLFQSKLKKQDGRTHSSR